MSTFSMDDLEELEKGPQLEEIDFNLELEPEEQGGDLEVSPDGEAGEEPARPAQPQEFRYGDDAPEELRGRTPQEALQSYTALRELTRTLIQRQNQHAQPAPSPEPQPLPELTEEDLLGTNPATVNQKLNQLFEAKAAPFVNDFYQKQSLLALSEAERNTQVMPYFGRYKQEILQLASQLPVDRTADVRTWKYLHDQVAMHHMHEILEEQVQARLSAKPEGAPTATAPAPATRKPAAPNRPPAAERGSGGGGAPKRTVKLSREHQAIARSLGVSNEEYARYLPDYQG